MVRVALERGQLLDVSLFGVGLVIPPWDFTLFDTDWIVNGVSGLFTPSEDIWALGDANRDGVVNEKDIALVKQLFGTSDPRADFDKDGVVSILDVGIAVQNYGLDRRGGIAYEAFSNIINGAVIPLFTAIPKAVWDLAKSTLDDWAHEYYEEHTEEGE